MTVNVIHFSHKLALRWSRLYTKSVACLYLRKLLFSGYSGTVIMLEVVRSYFLTSSCSVCLSESPGQPSEPV